MNVRGFLRARRARLDAEARDRGATSAQFMLLGGCLTGVVALFTVPLLLGGLVSAIIANGLGSGGGVAMCGSAVMAGVKQPTASAEASTIPKNYFALYQKAAAAWNIPWTVLAGIGWVETKHGTYDAAGVHSGENYAGAGGPMQFLQGTFERAKVDGDGDGKESRYNPADAIFSAAKLLKLHILPGGDDETLKKRTLTAAEIATSVHRYNPTPDHSYQNNVLGAANRYNAGYKLGEANNSGEGCSSIGLAGFKAGPFGQRIANAAAFYARRDPGTPNPPRWVGRLIPYSWGGGNGSGPSVGFGSGQGVVGFDCSGLALHAVYQASDGKVSMPRTAAAMYFSNLGVRVPRDQLAPGDLVFFHGASNPQHMGIFYGTFGGKRWMVEAPETGDFVKFSPFDVRTTYVGSLRVRPPAGFKEKPDTVEAMALSGAGAHGGGA